MRRESSRLTRQAQLLAQSLAEVLDDLAAAPGVDPETLAGPTMSFATIRRSIRALSAAADDLNAAGAALQRYATELAEGHELARRAQRRVVQAGLLLDGTRVLEPWGTANAQEAEQRRARVPEVQARVDLATAHVGRSRARLRREMTRLSASLSTHSLESHAGSSRSLPVRATRPTP